MSRVCHTSCARAAPAGWPCGEPGARAAYQKPGAARLPNNAGLSRLISLRHDFSTAFNRLLHSAAGTGFAAEPDLRDLPAVDVTAAFASGAAGTYEVTVTAAGDLAPEAPVAGDASAVNEARLADVLLYLRYALR